MSDTHRQKAGRKGGSLPRRWLEIPIDNYNGRLLFELGYDKFYAVANINVTPASQWENYFRLYAVYRPQQGSYRMICVSDFPYAARNQIGVRWRGQYTGVEYWLSNDFTYQGRSFASCSVGCGDPSAADTDLIDLSAVTGAYYSTETDAATALLNYYYGVN